MGICSYIMTVDRGLAPNPYHGWCTIAVCTPNRKGARKRSKGDWILGIAGSTLSRRIGGTDDLRLVYAMEIFQALLTLDEYFHDDRFQSKKPDGTMGTTPEELCGDNFYSLFNGILRHAKTTRAHDPGDSADIGGDRVYVSNNYWYFGRKAPLLDLEIGKSLIKQWVSRRGLPRTLESRFTSKDLQDWLSGISKGKSGKIGDPTDYEPKDFKI